MAKIKGKFTIRLVGGPRGIWGRKISMESLPQRFSIPKFIMNQQVKWYDEDDVIPLHPPPPKIKYAVYVKRDRTAPLCWDYYFQGYE